MRAKKKVLALLMMITLMGCMIAGCGNADTSTNGNQNAEVKTTESEEVIPDAEPEGDTEEGTTEVNEEVTTDETEEVTEEPKNEHIDGQTTLTYIGHASVKIVSADGRVIYIDPNYFKGDYSDEADILLVTHGHDDHKPHEDVKVKEGGTTITWKEAHPEGVYESFDIGDIHIEAVPASNSNHKIEECVGYIVTVDGVKIYHAGDTSMLDTMSELTDDEIDYAMYPIDGMYNMNAKAATEVADLIAAKNNIPIHEFDDYGKKKSDKFLPANRLILEYGETIVVKEQ